MNLLTSSLERVSSTDQLLSLSRFIVSENYIHHSDGFLSDNYNEEVNSIYYEEKQYFNNSRLFVAKELSGNIIGTIRTLEWNYRDTLPIQKIFDINPLHFSKDAESPKIWHIGRFAIRKDVIDRNLFKRLMICAIHPVCLHKNSFAFAECDSKLLRVLKLLGIDVKIIGSSIEYLGSETIPICMTTEGLNRFYKMYKDLVPCEILSEYFHYLESF